MKSHILSIQLHEIQILVTINASQIVVRVVENRDLTINCSFCLPCSLLQIPHLPPISVISQALPMSTVFKLGTQYNTNALVPIPESVPSLYWSFLANKEATRRAGFTPFHLIGDLCPRGPVKYDLVHMLDQAFSKQPLNEFCSNLPKNYP